MGTHCISAWQGKNICHGFPIQADVFMIPPSPLRPYRFDQVGLVTCTCRPNWCDGQMTFDQRHGIFLPRFISPPTDSGNFATIVVRSPLASSSSSSSSSPLAVKTVGKVEGFMALHLSLESESDQGPVSSNQEDPYSMLGKVNLPVVQRNLQACFAPSSKARSPF